MFSQHDGRQAEQGQEASPIMVAVDGSPDSATAVRWAVDDAFRRRLPLRIIHVLEHTAHELPRTASQESIAKGMSVLADAEQTARRRRPTVEVERELAEGKVIRTLCDRADAAATIVLGGTGAGGIAGVLLGTVSTHVACHAHCPVVVVRPVNETAHSEVVVGVDDGPQCEAALAFAFEQAVARGCPVRALHAWQVPVHAIAPEATFDLDEVRLARRHAVAERLAVWRDVHPGVEVIEDVYSAQPVEALVDASAKAELVVVGSRGLGALGAALLGSVSRGVLHHAQCPVAVVRS